MQQAGKTILISGAGSGLGQQLAESLAAEGYTVFACLRDTSKAPHFLNTSIHILPMDVCKEASVEEALKQLKEKYGVQQLDVLINNAGIVVPGPLENLTALEIKEQFEVNVFGVLSVTQKFLPLLKNAEGKIINIGSMSSRMALPFIGLYGASKASLKHISWALRIELHPWKVGVFHFELGNFESPIWKKSINRSHEANTKGYEEALKNTSTLMESRAAQFNSIDCLLKPIKKTIENKNRRFNTLIGNDARMRKFITWLFPYAILENILLKKIYRKK